MKADMSYTERTLFDWYDDMGISKVSYKQSWPGRIATDPAGPDILYALFFLS
jgi:hypothetical protein